MGLDRHEVGTFDCEGDIMTELKRNVVFISHRRQIQEVVHSDLI